MGLNRRPGSFHTNGDGAFDPNDPSMPDVVLPFTITDPVLAQPELPEHHPAKPSTPAHGEASADAATGQRGTADIHDVVFIDSSVPDIQDLLNGLKPGEKAFVIDANSDGLSQIATILQSQHLSNLSGIEIVAHGASGQLDLGSTVLNDADLAGHAAALSTIGAALAPGGDLSLYACDTAAGATGQQFISDLSHYAGGVDVAAATHLVGSAGGGGSWTLDASTGVPVTAASVPFTSAALGNYQGELSTPETGQLFFINFEQNTDGTTDTRQINYLDSNNAGGTPAFVAASQANGIGTSYLIDPKATGFDTPNGLFFALDSTGKLYSGHISTGAEVTTGGSQAIASESNGDAYGAMTVDPVNHFVYVGIFGGAVNANDTSENEIYAISYNPQSGALGTPQYDTSNLTNDGNTAETLISTASDPNFGDAASLTLDQASGNLYVVENSVQPPYIDTYPGGSFTFPEKNEIDVISSTERNQASQETLVSLPTLELSNGSTNPAYIGSIGGVAVDHATDKLYFTVDNPASGPGGIYYVSLTGGADQTPTELSLNGLNSNLTANGLLLNDFDNITFDPATGQLYVTSLAQTVSGSSAIADPGEIYQFTLNGSGTAFTGASIFYQYGTATTNEFPFGQQSNLDFVSLPVLTTTGTTAAAVHNGAAITLLTGAPTITDSSGVYIDSATVQILDGTTVESGDVLTINGTPIPSTPTTFVDDGSIFDVSYSTTTNTLTITTQPNSSLLDYTAYAHILGEVQYTDNSSDTAQRTVTWQVNNDAPGTPSGVNETTTTVDIQTIPSAPTITTEVGHPVGGSTIEVEGNGQTTGDTIKLYSGATLVGTGTVLANDTFQITTTVTFTEGTHTLTATETNGVGTSQASAGFTADLYPPAPSITTLVGQPVNGGTVHVQGRGETVGDTITLYDGATVVGTGTVVAGATFDITTSTDFTDGAHTLTATETDGSNLTSAASAGFAVNVDPSAPSITTLVGQPVNGGTVHVQGTGETVGDTITVYEGATVVGTGKVLAGDTFDITTSTDFTDGNHTLTATETDSSNLTSGASAGFAVNVDPSAPSITAQTDHPLTGSTVEVTGTGETVGDTITLYEGATMVGTGKVLAGGTFDIITTATFTDGAHTLTATETDAANLTSGQSAGFVADVYPDAPSITTLVGQPVNGGTVHVQGTGETVGDTITLYDGATVVGTGQVLAGGAFDIIKSTDFTDGNHTLTATETDSSSLTSAASTGFAVAVDPNAPLITAQTGHPVGVSAIEVTGTGETVGDTITLYDGATVVGTGKVLAGDIFDITTTQTFTEGAYTLTATETDGSNLTSAPSAGFVADVYPNAPAITAQVGHPLIGSAIEVTGTGETVGDTITIYEGATVVGTGKVLAGDTFDITTSKTFLDGTHTLTATETDGSGLTSAASAGFVADVYPGAPLITGLMGQLVNGGVVQVEGLGEPAGGIITLYDGTTVIGSVQVAGSDFDITTTFTDGTHTLTATETDSSGLVSPASTSFVANIDPSAPSITAQTGHPLGGSTIEVTGTGETVGDTITLYEGATVVGQGTVVTGVAGNTFEITTTKTFAEGAHTLTATETDSSNLTSAQSADFTADVYPNAPAITAQVGHPLTGSTIEVTGTGETVGDTITLYEGATIVGTGQVLAGDTFDIITTATFTDGTHMLTATETDASHITSAASAGFVADVYPDAPSNLASVGQPANGSPIEVTGTGETVGDTITLYEGATIVGSGKVLAGDTFDITTTQTFADGTHILTATETDSSNLTSAASGGLNVNVDPSAPSITAQVGHPVGGSTIEVTGIGEAVGDVIKLYEGGTIVGQAIIVAADDTFDITTSQTFAEGAYTLTATETDSAGLTSALSAAFVADVYPPAPVITAQTGHPLTGSTIEVTGTGDTVGDTITLYEGVTVVGTGTVLAGGTFDITTTSTFTDGTHTLTATETDASHITSAQSASFIADVYPNAPAITAVAGQPVNGGTMQVEGTGETVGDIITLYEGATVVGHGTVAAGDTFDITTSQTFTDGTHTLTATETDASNLASAQSTGFTVDVDPNAPSITTLVNATGTGVNETNHSAVEVSGTAEAGDKVTLYDTNGTTVLGTAIASNANSYTITTAALPDGTHGLTATATDPALLTSLHSAVFDVTVDTTPPILTGITASPGSGSIFAGATDTFIFSFDEAVDVTGGRPTLTLNDGGTAVYDAAATAALHDPTKLAFDYLVSSSDTPTQSLAITGYVANGATVTDLAGNLANLSSIAETFSGLSVNESHTAPAMTFNGFTRPALDFDFAGNIILGPAALAAESAFGIKFLYAGLPESTPYPPVAENSLTDFHLIA
jgi:Domain of unknown function (DUF4347)/Bacterial Ig-like domain